MIQFRTFTARDKSGEKEKKKKEVTADLTPHLLVPSRGKKRANHPLMTEAKNSESPLAISNRASASQAQKNSSQHKK